MATDPQANWRIPHELQVKVRMLATQLGVRPRDIVVNALEQHFAGGDLVPPKARPQRAVIPAETPAETPAENGAIVATGTMPADEPEELPACAECGGDLERHPERADVARCVDCGTLVDLREEM